MKFSTFSVTMSCMYVFWRWTYSNYNTVFNCIYLIMSICVFGNMVHWLLTVNVWQMLTFSRKCFLKVLFFMQFLFFNLSIQVYVPGGKHQNELWDEWLFSLTWDWAHLYVYVCNFSDPVLEQSICSTLFVGWMNKYAFILLKTKQDSLLLTPLSHQIIFKTPWLAALVTAQSVWSRWRWWFRFLLNNPRVPVWFVVPAEQYHAILNPLLMAPLVCFHSLASLRVVAYQHIPSCDHIKAWMIMLMTLFIHIALSILHRHYLITPYSPLRRKRMCQILSSLFHMRKLRHQGLLWLTSPELI